MAETYGAPSGDLATHGIEGVGNIHWNLSATELIDLAVERKEGEFSAHNALVTKLGKELGARQMTSLLFTNLLLQKM